MRQKSNCLKLLFLVFLLLPAISSAETINGKVVSVADGDTITVLTPEHKQIKIRLAAVDTPEKNRLTGKRPKILPPRELQAKMSLLNQRR
jgi:micrococcal nuclease